MKKLKIAIISTIFFALSFSAFAEEPKFTRDYSISTYRLYNNSEYLEGNYRSNFVSIPMNRMLNYMDGFERKVGVFELDGNTLYLGYNNNGKGTLQLCDENKHFFISADSYKEHEESYFRYEQGVGLGIVCEIELKEKKYTVAVANISSNKAGIYPESSGFRMWVENESAKDTAWSKKAKLGSSDIICYDWADLFEGVYKPGWKRLWGTVSGYDENGYTLYKYNYKGTDFILTWNNDGEKQLVNMDGAIIPIKFLSQFSLWNADVPENRKAGYGMGVEADVQLGKNKVQLAFLSCDGQKRVFVKDTTGYPVISQPKTAQAKSKKTEKAKKSGKSAAFTRDYNKWRRVYSKDDISKGLYKSNYKNIPVSAGEKVSFTVKMKEKGDVTLSTTTGIFKIDDYQLSIFYNPEMGWQIIQKDNNIKSLNYRTKNRFDLSDEKNGFGTQAEMTVVINDKPYDLVFIHDKGDYKVFIKTGANTESALCEKDSFGNEYYDIIDMRSDVYKPGFESCSLRKTTDEAYTKLFDKPEDNDCIYICDYKGYKFLVGPSQDPADYVKALDGSVIFNPETQIRYRTENKNGESECNQGMSYGWEGKVRLNEKDVTLAYIKWSNAVCVFVKE